ncbi:MAG: thiamine-phosphate kinase [Candidatus Electrothrix sp. YB6]
MNERDLIAHIRQLADAEADGLLQGIGDDCAVIAKDRDTVWLLTMDTLTESVHFNCAWHPPKLLGRKAVSVNVSDIAAMGGKPVFALLSLSLPADFDPHWADRLSRGITGACQEYGCLLIGGDTVRSRDISLTLTVIGEMQRDQVLYRHTAEPGDTIFVSGPLGYSAAGLALLQSGRYAGTMEQGVAACPSALQPFIKAHLNPWARVDLVPLLARTGLIHAMMDLSDGLATDLSHLCQQSGTGARIEEDRLPGRSALAAAAAALPDAAVTDWITNWMTVGGEDYELLFTAASADTETLLRITGEQQLPVYPIGTITKGQNVTLVRQTEHGADEQRISFQGFDHFSRK